MAANLLVNLDAMITRADFAQIADDDKSYETFERISIRDTTNEGLIGRILRKPDFQRETNHWTPEQVISLLESFINGDLIPSVILWKSPTYLFVIDGGHRLSVLRAWVEDDYGDGPMSLKFFGNLISQNQKKAAEKTRKLVSEKIGSYQHIKTRIDNNEMDHKLQAVLTRALPVQWVKGDADKAEVSFFKINTQGTPLDAIEQSLLENRKRPIAIAARAIIRAGKGHKYWSKFSRENTNYIEEIAKNMHFTLFDPEISSPVKTLDLPLGGSKGIRTALQILIDYLEIANIKQDVKKINIDFGSDDDYGDQTIAVLKKAAKLANRITGNDKGSLGLHPAVYFYGPSGSHSAPLFLGTANFISEKLVNNDSDFFRKFTMIREKLEEILITHKELIATILQRVGSVKRSSTYSLILDSIYKSVKENQHISDIDIVRWAGLSGKIVVGEEKSRALDFSDETKSRVFINFALKNELKCPICGGYIDSKKSMSYDHIIRKQDGGTAAMDNCQITHPYCNQSIKN